MTGIVLAIAAAYGVHLVYSHAAFGWTGIRPAPRTRGRRPERSLEQWLVQAGLEQVTVRTFVATVAAMVVAGSAIGFVVFGAPAPSIASGLLVGLSPIASYRRRRDSRRLASQDAWPRLIEEVRIRSASAGRSIPQALFEAGGSGPPELRSAFESARREWVLSTDFERTLDVLKHRLADPTADAACETLLVAHEVGGTDLERRLDALADDRRADAQGRKDARARQSGVRFARGFTIAVPLGMACVGLSIGDGRKAYQSTNGQIVVLAALGMMVACWWWASRIMRLPEEQRVFDA